MMIMDALKKNDDAHAMHMLDAIITLGCYSSDRNNLSIYFTREKQKCFWLFSPGLRVEYFWVVLEMEMGGYMWMRTSRVEAACVSERASES